MASLIGAHYSRNGIKQFPARVILSMYGNGLGGDETHPDTITILRDTRIFPSGEAPPDFHTFDPVASGISWDDYGRYWYSERTEVTPPPDSDIGFPNFKTCWDALPPADCYTIINEQGGNDPWALQRAVDIERAISWAAGADGRKCCLMNLAGGTPGDFELWKTIVAPFIVEAWDAWGHIYGRHVYADQFIDANGNVAPGQPQRVINELRHLQSIGYGGGVVLTECGLDGGYGVADLSRFTYQVQAWEAALRPYADILIGFCWWECGASGFGADYTNHLKALIPFMNNSYLGRWEPAEPTQPPGGGGEPPMKHKAIVVKLPQDMTADEWRTAADAAYPFRHTMTASHDDMLTVLVGGNAESYVKFSHPERDFVAVEKVELAGYSWQPLYAAPPEPPPAPLEIINIVDELPKHATLKYATRPLDVITTLTIHHTVSPPDRSIESIAAYHVNSNGWPGIGYHFVIKADGRIFQTNHLTTKSYHAGSAAVPGDENLFSVGIALQGDFTSAPPPQAQLDAARALVAHLLTTLPSATAVLGHRQMPGAATACPGATWQQWLPYVAGGEIVKPDPPPPPPPPVGQLVDMTQYYLPPNGRTYGDISIKPTNWGQGDVRQQLQLHGGYLFVTKGNEFEKRMILDGRIYFLMDDSPGDGKYYTVNSPTAWIPGQWRVGETFARQETATFYYKANCQPTGEVSNWSNQMLFKAFYPEWTSPHGLKLANVAHLQWLVNGAVEEDYWLAPGLGYAGWKNRHGRESWIKELIPHTDQQPNKFYGSCYHAPFG